MRSIIENRAAGGKAKVVGEMLSSHPNIGELRPDVGVPGCRCFSVKSYVIFFRKIERGIEIARIVQGSRDLRRL